MQEVRIPDVWFLCFPLDDYDESDPRAIITKLFCEFFRNKGAELLNSVITQYLYKLQPEYYQECSFVDIDYNRLVELCVDTGLTNALFNHPSESIGCMTAAAMIVTAVNGVFNSHLQVRIQNYGPLTPFKDIKANLVGKLVAIKGTIIRVGGIRSMIMKMSFECDLCGATMQVVCNN